MQHIVICADGTWNRPEEEPDDVATNVLRLARAVRPFSAAGQPQHVFYDWGIGSYYERVRGGRYRSWHSQEHHGCLSLYRAELRTG